LDCSSVNHMYQLSTQLFCLRPTERTELTYENNWICIYISVRIYIREKCGEVGYLTNVTFCSRRMWLSLLFLNVSKAQRAIKACCQLRMASCCRQGHTLAFCNNSNKQIWNFHVWIAVMCQPLEPWERFYLVCSTAIHCASYFSALGSIWPLVALDMFRCCVVYKPAIRIN